MLTSKQLLRIAKHILSQDDNEDKIYHTSPKPIQPGDITENGLFGDCLFFSNVPYYMSTASKYVYSLDTSNMDFIEPEEFYFDENWEQLSGIEEEIIDQLKVDKETAEKILSGTVNTWDLMQGPWDEGEAQSSISSTEEASDVSWKIQKMQGTAAKILGYDGAATEDEQGIVYIVPMLGREDELILEETDD